MLDYWLEQVKQSPVSKMIITTGIEAVKIMSQDTVAYAPPQFHAEVPGVFSKVQSRITVLQTPVQEYKLKI